MSNNIDLNVVFFEDNQDQRTLLSEKIKISGFNINKIFIDPNDFYDAESNSFSLEALENHVLRELNGLHINLIATDWNLFEVEPSLKFKGIDSVQLLLRIKPKLSKVQFLIYSGNINEASEYVLKKIVMNINEAIGKGDSDILSMELINDIFSTRIDFCSRGEYFAKVNELLKKEVSLKNIVLNSLEASSLAIINTGNDNFDGRTLEELTGLINIEDIKGLKFIKEFTELAIANYSELNV